MPCSKPDHLQSLGVVAIGSRLKRVSDRIMADGLRVYQSTGIDFKPSWLPVFSLLAAKGGLTVGQIAKAVGQSHVAISKMAHQLNTEGLVEIVRGEQDHRKTIVSLSAHGRRVSQKINAICHNIQSSVSDLFLATPYQPEKLLNDLDALFEKGRLYHSTVAKSRKPEFIEKIEIIPYDPQYKVFFRTLNEAWISRFFKLEDIDEKVLGDPEKHILKKGGRIFFARCGDSIVGTCALKKDRTGFELTKMAVSEHFQGHRIGNRLLSTAIREAKKLKAKRIYLETASSLERANRLYVSSGFKHIPLKKNSIYRRADVAMEMKF